MATAVGPCRHAGRAGVRQGACARGWTAWCPGRASWATRRCSTPSPRRGRPGRGARHRHRTGRGAGAAVRRRRPAGSTPPLVARKGRASYAGRNAAPGTRTPGRPRGAAARRDRRPDRWLRCVGGSAGRSGSSAGGSTGGSGGSDRAGRRDRGRELSGAVVGIVVVTPLVSRALADAGWRSLRRCCPASRYPWRWPAGLDDATFGTDGWRYTHPARHDRRGRWLRACERGRRSRADGFWASAVACPPSLASSCWTTTCGNGCCSAGAAGRGLWSPRSVPPAGPAGPRSPPRRPERWPANCPARHPARRARPAR